MDMRDGRHDEEHTTQGVDSDETLGLSGLRCNVVWSWIRGIELGGVKTISF